MVNKRILSPQSVWQQDEVLAAFEEKGIKPLHAYRVWSHLLRRGDTPWANIPELSKAAVAVLSERFTLSTSRVVTCKTSGDGETTKLLVRLQDGMDVESVIMHYDNTRDHQQDDTKQQQQQQQPPEQLHEQEQQPTEDVDSSDAYSDAVSTVTATAGRRGHKRATLCVSSQVGCQMGCTFCATGTMGLKGHLTTGEIIEQMVHASRITPIRNCVFMGMGEPLNNYPAVRSAVTMMTDQRLFGLSRRHVTVSTVGVVPRLLQLADDLPGVSLALSLHAPTQELRQRIVPSARAYPLHKLMAAVESYQQKSGQKVFVEYVVLRGVNDGPEVAAQLGALLQGRNVVVNLIPWNPVYSPDGPAFEAPDASTVSAMQQVLRQEYRLATTIRQEKGQDISGACGQLVVEHQNGCQSTSQSTDIEDFGK